MAYDAAGVFVLARGVPLPRASPSRVTAGMVQVGFDDAQTDDAMFREDKGIIGHLVHTGLTVLVPDVTHDSRYSQGRRGTRFEQAVPIVSNRIVIGALNVESDRPDAFSRGEAELLEFFASAAAMSIEKGLLQRQVPDKQWMEVQLEMTHDIQAALLPADLPSVPGYDIAAANLPAWGVGGEY